MKPASGKTLASQIVGGSAVSIGIRSAGLVLGYAVHVLLSRLLGLQGYGQYVIALGWVLVLVLPARLGFDYSALRYVTGYLESNNTASLRGFIRLSIATISLVSVLVGIVMVVTGNSLDQAVDPVILISASTLILPLALLGYLSVLMRTARHFLASQFYDQVLRGALLILLLGGTVLLFKDLTASAGLLLTSVAAWVALAALGFHFRTTFSNVRPSAPSYVDIKAWFTLSIPLLGITLSQELLNQIEIILLGVLADARAAGLFAAASRLASLMSFAQAALGIVSGPLIASAYHRRDVTELQYITTLTARIGLLFACIVAVGLVLLGKPLLGIFGTEFRVGFVPLMILIIGGLLNAFTGVVAYLLTLTGRERTALMIFLGSIGVSVGLNLLLIPRIGVEGAAIASSAALGFWNVVMLVYVRRALGIDASVFGLSPRRP